MSKLARILLASAVVILLLLPAGAFAQDGDDSQILITEDGLISLEFPQDWFASLGVGNSILVASNESLLEPLGDELAVFASGETAVSITMVVAEYASLAGFPGGTLEEKLERVGFLLNSRNDPENPSITVGDVEMITLPDDKEAWTLDFAIREDYEGRIYMWMVTEEVLGFATMSTAPGETSLVEETAAQIVSNVTFHGSLEALLEAAAESE